MAIFSYKWQNASKLDLVAFYYACNHYKQSHWTTNKMKSTQQFHSIQNVFVCVHVEQYFDPFIFALTSLTIRAMHYYFE